MYTPSRIIDSFFIAGFQYHEGAQVLSKLKVGKKIKMIAEFDNPYDPNAVALYYKGSHLGYVPRVKNALVAQLLRFGHAKVFECHVVQVNKKKDPQSQVRVSLSVTDKRK